MEILELFVDLLKAFAWPALIVFIFIYFKKHW